MKLMNLIGILVNTIPGIEDVAASEVAEILGRRRCFRIVQRPYGLGGKVIIEGELAFEDGKTLISKGRSLEKVIALLKIARVGRDRDALRTIYEEAKEIPWEGCTTPFSRIAVRAQREGRHEYTSVDVARVVGQAILDRVKSIYGIRPPVDLRSPTLVVYSEVVGDRLILGIDLTGGHALHERNYRAFVHPAALRPTVAYALLRIAGVKEGDVILDPMCGSGTILIEAALSFERVKLYGMDINPDFIDGARRSALMAGVLSRIEFRVGDAREIDEEFQDMEFDHIITNPPYGVRMRPLEVNELYKSFIQSATRVLRRGGKLTIITLKYRLAKRFAQKAGLTLVHERSIYLGGLQPHILVFIKR